MSAAPWTWDAYRPGAAAELLRLQISYYSRHWQFGRQFEATVAEELGEFLARYDPEQHLFLTAWDEAGALVGSVTIDRTGVEAPAHLRWFVVDEAMQGRGLGKALFDSALAFCRQRGYGRIELTTFEGLHAARALYERAGFRLTERLEKDPWSGTVGLQRFVLELSDRRNPPPPITG